MAYVIVGNFTGKNGTLINPYLHDPTYTHSESVADSNKFLNTSAWVIFSTGIVLIPIAIIGLFSLKDNVYVINLLLCDFIQIVSMGMRIATERWFYKALGFSLQLFCWLVSVGFMVCISMERYLIIAWPLWYRFRRNKKHSVVVCVVVWHLPLLVLLFTFLSEVNMFLHSALYLLLPFPLFIFFLVGTIRALSAARSVPADEKRRIVAILVAVLMIYTLLFLPIIVFFLSEKYDEKITSLALFMINTSPLADLIMYILIRKETSDKLLAVLCCGKIFQETSSQNIVMSASRSQTI